MTEKGAKYKQRLNLEGLRLAFEFIINQKSSKTPSVKLEHNKTLKATHLSVHGLSFFTADVLICRSRENTGVTNNTNDGSALFKCPNKLRQ